MGLSQDSVANSDTYPIVRIRKQDEGITTLEK